MNKPEILAPAGGVEQLIAAVRSGANAVYLGTKNFNARQNAQNFSNEELVEAVKYCHARGVKVYVTLNTLVSDDERDELCECIKSICEAGVDAVIIQDLMTAKLCRQICPQMPMHASTQMTAHNAYGVSELAKLGFKRVVLARELSENEIADIAKKVPDMELEIFVHGALCMSVSGQCAMSAMIGGRSGNRGNCAQPCRLDFVCSSRHNALSLKDMSIVTQLEKVAEIGVCSLKIEGRMKRPEYVAAAVQACKAALNGETPDMHTLRAIFSRSGFTDGYFIGERDLSMFGVRTKEDVQAADSVLKRVASSYRKEMPLIPLEMSFTARKNEFPELSVSDGSSTVTVTGAVKADEAVKRELTCDAVEASLKKCGGTPFYAEKIHTEIDGGISITAPKLNALRTQAIEELTEKRIQVNTPNYAVNEIEKRALPRKVAQKRELRLSVHSADMLTRSMIITAEKIYAPMGEVLKNAGVMKKIGDKLIAVAPSLIFQNDEAETYEKLKQLKQLGVKDICVDNIGTVKMARELDFEIHGGMGLNIYNSDALAEYEKMGISDAILSFELTAKKINKIWGTVPTGVVTYGYLPIMKYRNCPAKKKTGKCCDGKASITDRTGASFKLICHDKKYQTLLNSVPLWLADKQSEFYGVDFQILSFTTEKISECERITAEYVAGVGMLPKYTRGLYFR